MRIPAHRLAALSPEERAEVEAALTPRPPKKI